MPAIIPQSPHNTWAAYAQSHARTDRRGRGRMSPLRDIHEDLFETQDVHYHIQLPALSTHSIHDPSPLNHAHPSPSVYPPSAYVPQPHDPNVRLVSYSIPPGAMIVRGNHEHPSWQHQPVVRMPPPPVPHKVWILDCKSCGTFLTNRGMKAVLLLRPNVPLYSTDAMPINCSASSANDPPLHPSTSYSSPSDIERFHVNTRTCECLTQTLYCHGCGSGVGYMIVSPCHRCTSSISVTNRTTNGHRFVFYSSEIVACERHYISGEAGIRSPVVSLLPAPAPDLPEIPPHSHPNALTSSSSSSSNSGIFASLSSNTSLGRVLDEPSDMDSITSSPPPLSYAHSPSNYRYRRSNSQSPMPDLSPVPSQAQAAHLREVPTHRPELSFEPLRAGNVLFWHHLVRSGEMPAVVDDPRARVGPLSIKVTESSVVRGDGSGGQMQSQGRRGSVARRIVAGR